MLSVDGVSESKSTSVSLDVYSLKFNCCREIYPLKIVRPLKKFHLNHQEQLNLVLRAVIEAALVIQAFIGDNPKRAFVKYTMQHSGKCGCEYCFASGVPFKDASEQGTIPIIRKIHQQKLDIQIQIDFLQESGDTGAIETLKDIVKHLDEAESIAKKQRKSSHIVWPANTFQGGARTKEKILVIVEKIEAGEELTPSEKKGIKGRSPLLDIDYFDFVLHVPAEYMHLVCLGVTKRMLELSFDVGEVRSRITKTPLSSSALFNEYMKAVKMFHE